MNLLFCHIGSSLPKHLLENIVRTSSLFPSFQIDLIKDKKHRLPPKLLKIKQLRVFDYDYPTEYQRLFDKSEHDLKFRNGFWRSTLERLIAICHHLKDQENFPYLHIESDVILMQTFPFGELTKVNQLTWGFYNQLRDVASLIYVPNKNASEWLLAELLKEFVSHPNHTDMTILKSVSKSKSHNVRYFPMELNTLRNRKNPTSTLDLEDILARTVEIEGIFDSAAIGMWLTGIDPHNNYGVQKYFDRSFIDNGDSLIDPSGRKFEVEGDFELHVVAEGKKIPIHCLHIHSKDLGVFKQKNLKKTHFMQVYKTEVSTQSKFRIKVIGKLIWDAIKNQELLKFVAFAPRIRIVTRQFLKLKK